MGVCRSFWKQVSTDGKTSSWRFMLPLSLSWDHRVIDGASAARFNTYFAGLLADMRRVLLCRGKPLYKSLYFQVLVAIVLGVGARAFLTRRPARR